MREKENYSVLCILHKTSFTFLFIWSDGQLSVNCSERVLSLLNAVLSLGRVFWAVLQCWDGDRGLERSRVLRGPSCQLSSIPSPSSLLVSAQLSHSSQDPFPRLPLPQSVIIANYQIPPAPTLRLSSLNWYIFQFRLKSSCKQWTVRKRVDSIVVQKFSCTYRIF